LGGPRTPEVGVGTESGTYCSPLVGRSTKITPPGVGLSGAMGARAVRVVSGAIWPFAVTLALGGLGLPIFYRGADSAGEFGPALSIFFVLVLLGLVSLGVLVSSRRPGNPVGWIITGSGMSLMVSGFAQSYGIYALYTDPGNMPGDAFMAWISS
jgi:hypothetical protein